MSLSFPVSSFASLTQTMHAPNPLQCVGVGQWNVSTHWYTAMCTFLWLNKSIEQDYIKWTECPGQPIHVGLSWTFECLKTAHVMLHAAVKYKLYSNAFSLAAPFVSLTAPTLLDLFPEHMLLPWGARQSSPSNNISQTQRWQNYTNYFLKYQYEILVQKMLW